MLPKIFNHISDNLNDIIKIVKKIPEDDISYYWDVSVSVNNCVSEWKTQCLIHCKKSLNNKQYNVIAKIINNNKNT